MEKGVCGWDVTHLLGPEDRDDDLLFSFLSFYSFREPSLCDSATHIYGRSDPLVQSALENTPKGVSFSQLR